MAFSYLEPLLFLLAFLKPGKRRTKKNSETGCRNVPNATALHGLRSPSCRVHLPQA